MAQVEVPVGGMVTGCWVPYYHLENSLTSRGKQMICGMKWHTCTKSSNELAQEGRIQMSDGEIELLNRFCAHLTDWFEGGRAEGSEQELRRAINEVAPRAREIIKEAGCLRCEGQSARDPHTAEGAV